MQHQAVFESHPVQLPVKLPLKRKHLEVCTIDVVSAYSTVCHSKYCHGLQGGCSIRMY